MRNVLLYPRVSSDEQSKKGYTLRDQDDRLLLHCEREGKTVLGVFAEDHSAWYGFDRPRWNEMMAYVKANRGKVDEILFINWTRFSRNQTEALKMIQELRRYGVTVNAIDEWLDFTKPFSKVMLSFYLSMAEHDNDQRSINTIAGIRRAQKEGRYLGMAPIGYINAKDPEGKPIILPDPERTGIVRGIFEDYTAGLPNQDVLANARKNGFNLQGHDALKRVISNIVYTGKILVKAYSDQDKKIVQGIHQAIVGEELYWAAQNRLNRENMPQPKLRREELPLRGVLFCECGKLLTGGRVKGKKQHYWYYMPHRCGNKNHLADRVHKQFKEMLQSMSLPSTDLQELYSKAEQQMEQRLSQDTRTLSHVTNEYNTLKTKLNSLNDKYISELVDHATYVAMKGQYTADMLRKQQRIKELSQGQEAAWKLFKENLHKLGDLYFLYDTKELSAKQQLINALFPGCLNRATEGFRTPYLVGPFVGKELEVKHLSVTGLSRVVPINAVTPMRVDDGSEFKHLLQIIAA